MDRRLPDDEVRSRINELAWEEEQIYGDTRPSGLTAEQRGRLAAIKVERDQQYDLLHQLQALSDAGLPPSGAELRSPETVEGYEQ